MSAASRTGPFESTIIRPDKAWSADSSDRTDSCTARWEPEAGYTRGRKREADTWNSLNLPERKVVAALLERKGLAAVKEGADLNNCRRRHVRAPTGRTVSLWTKPSLSARAVETEGCATS